jgi:hypothetical protein
MMIMWWWIVAAIYVSFGLVLLGRGISVAKEPTFAGVLLAGVIAVTLWPALVLVAIGMALTGRDQ